MRQSISKTVNPKQYITESDVKKLIEKLDEFREQNNWWFFTRHAAYIQMVDSTYLDGHISAQDEDQMVSELHTYRTENNWRNFTFQAARIKCLNRDLLNGHITKEDEASIVEMLHMHRSDSQAEEEPWLEFTLHAGRIKELGLLQVDKHLHQKDNDHMLEALYLFRHNNDWVRFTHQATYMFIINPSLLDNQLLDSDIAEIVKLLDVTREMDAYQHFAYQIAHMQILSDGFHC